MQRLILLNGAPAVGKSTLALRYAVDHPLTLALDIDRVRGMLGAWEDDATTAGLLARDLAVAMAREHLRSGHDVVVPQLLGRAELVDRLAALAADEHVTFVEVLVSADAAEARRRFALRSASPEHEEHSAAARSVARAGGDAALDELRERVLALAAARPSTRVLESVPDDVEATYTALLRLLDDDAPTRTRT